jgi:ammonium transporter, Amt family
MTALAPSASDLALLLATASILLIPLSIAGIALINTGLGRSRNSAHLMMSSLCVVGIAAASYVVCGFSWQGLAGGPARVITLAGKNWNWVAKAPLFLQGVTAPPVLLTVWMQSLCVGLSALIPTGGAAERWRLSSTCASTAIFSGITYPLYAHWVWGGGWLATLGTDYGLGRGFVDAGGSGVIHTVGGLTALALVWILGPRRSKYTADGMPTAIPAHNAVFVLFGSILAWAGWIGLNISGAVLLNGIDARAAGLIGVNTTLAGGSAALMTAIVTRLRFNRPDASLTANGWVTGLVAGSAGCPFVPPAAAIFIGLIAGLLAPLTIEILEARLSIDDPGGVISVHAIGGIWGLMAVGIFGRFPAEVLVGRGSGNSGQWVAQLVGVATLVGFILPLTYGLNWLLNRFLPHRVTQDGERQGLDLHELGAGAYPEFVTHSEEFFQR